MQVIADVDEADIGGVKEGQRVEFSVDAYPNDTFEGTVTQVRLEATEESNVVTYEVVISAPQPPDLKLKPGLTANVTIYIAERRNVINIPLKATPLRPRYAFGTSSGSRVATAAPEAGQRQPQDYLGTRRTIPGLPGR